MKHSEFPPRSHPPRSHPPRTRPGGPPRAVPAGVPFLPLMRAPRRRTARPVPVSHPAALNGGRPARDQHFGRRPRPGSRRIPARPPGTLALAVGATAAVAAVAWSTGPTGPGTVLTLLSAVVVALAERWTRRQRGAARRSPAGPRTAGRGAPVGHRLGAGAILLLTLPVLVGVAVAVRLTGPGPVLVRVPGDGGNGPAPGRLHFRAGGTAVPHRLWLDDLPHLLDVVRGGAPFRSADPR